MPIDLETGGFMNRWGSIGEKGVQGAWVDVGVPGCLVTTLKVEDTYPCVDMCVAWGTKRNTILLGVTSHRFG